MGTPDVPLETVVGGVELLKVVCRGKAWANESVGTSKSNTFQVILMLKRPNIAVDLDEDLKKQVGHAKELEPGQTKTTSKMQAHGWIQHLAVLAHHSFEGSLVIQL